MTALPTSRSNKRDPYRVGLAMLARREHSRGELERKLRAKFPAAAAEAAATRLEAEGYLSEQRFAETLVRDKAPKWGRSRLLKELRARGADAEVAQAALATVLGGSEDYASNEADRAEKIIRAKHGSGGPADSRQLARCWRLMLSRGFAANDIRAALAALASLNNSDAGRGSEI